MIQIKTLVLVLFSVDVVITFQQGQSNRIERNGINRYIVGDVGVIGCHGES